MKIGIIVHSHTGNTYSVAERIKEEFLKVGHILSIEKVVAVDDKQAAVEKVKLKAIPDVDAYDVLIFGAPVRGFSLSPVMGAYLLQVTSLKGKKVICYATQSFPYKWMGGNRTIVQMKKICESKGAKILGTDIINWSSKLRQKRIDDMALELSKIF